VGHGIALPAEDAGMRRVLAIDDDPSILAVVKDILGSSGYTISVAPSAAEALKKIEMDTFDLVITDLRMPGMSGQELIAQLRQHPTYRKVPIVVLATGAEEAELATLKVDMRIGKPFVPRTLLTAVAALIG
jgi:CheY-like chemotaxis protein